MSVVRLKQEPLGQKVAMAAQHVAPAKQFIPKPEFHKTGAPPTMQYHKHHPMLTSPAVQPAIPGSPAGPNQHALDAYLKVLRGNPAG